jgi:hypothetical protein
MNTMILFKQVQFRNFCNKVPKPKDDGAKVLRLLYKYKHTIISLICQGILIANKFTTFAFFCTGFTLYNFIKEGGHQTYLQNLIDKQFTSSKNVRILIAFE